MSERREKLECEKSVGNRGVDVQSVREIGRGRKRKLPVCLPAMPACLSPLISFSQRSLPEDASIVLFVSRLF